MVERFGQYEIIKKIATGGMAEVLLARQESVGGFERLVCIKRILPHLSEREDFVKMFQDEARIAANLNHPNIAQIYEIAEVDETLYISMEYVRGEDLRHVYNREVARDRAIPQEIAAHVIMGAAEGLDYAHRQTTISGRPLGIVHRDISPQNLLLTYDGHVKIVDFGVAKATGKMTETRSGVLKGKYSYMSPEQASGNALDGRTDIFALGVTLYEVTTGTRLFKREHELETLHAVIACNVTPPSSLVPAYHKDLEAIVMRALTKEPEKRYQTAAELEHDLEHYLIRHGHTPSPSVLATYMHALFADKLADDALPGGHPWHAEEAHAEEAASQQHETAAHKKSLAVTRADAPESVPQTEVSPNPNDWELSYPTAEETVPQSTITPHMLDVDDSHVTTSVTVAERPRLPRLSGLMATAFIAVIVVGSGYLISTTQYTPKRPPATIVEMPATSPRPSAPSAVAPVAPVAPVAEVGDLPSSANTPSIPDKTAPSTPQHLATLHVTAALPLTISLDGKPLGTTPLQKTDLKPGVYRLSAHSEKEGFTLKRRVRLSRDQVQTLHFDPDTGYLVLNAKPWAFVQIGQRPAIETPIRLETYEGDYRILFECPNGERKVRNATVTPGLMTVTTLRCGGEPK